MGIGLAVYGASQSYAQLTDDADTTANLHWPQWRGPDRNGVSTASDELPTSWDHQTNVLWKTALEGRGHSSPIVWGDRVFLTTDIEGDVIPGANAPVHLRAGEPYEHPAAESADRRHTLKVMALDASSGGVVWERTVHDGRVFDNRHGRNTYASPTAVTDGEHVFTYFGSQGVFAFDFDGELKWKADLGSIRTWGHGHGTSPVLYRDSVLLQIDQNEGEGSFLVALYRDSGREKWRTARSERINYSSPILVDAGDRHDLITTSYEQVIAYDPETGKERWRVGGFIGNAVPTPVSDGELVFVVSGYPDKLTRAIRIPDEGAEPELVWEYGKGSGYTPSPLLYDGYLYLVSDKGILTCIEPATGEIVYEGGRIPVATFVRASPVAWEDKILLAGEDGDYVVVRAGASHAVLSVNSMDETVTASPAIAGSKIFLRTESHLYAIGPRGR